MKQVLINSMVVLASLGLISACSMLASQQPTDSHVHDPALKAVTPPDYQDAELNWLDYADAKADANLAIQNRQFHLLAFAGRAMSFPGLEPEQVHLKNQCGYQVLANSSDALTSTKQHQQRKALYQYAATYNRLVSAACSKATGD